jgi:hypothetical protein
VGAPDLEVGRIVSGRHLQRARAELGLDALVGDHADPLLGERDDDLAPDDISVPIVVRVHRDRDVREDRRRPHGRDRDVAAALGE